MLKPSAFFTPFAGAQPTGPDLSFSPAIDQIAELRRFDDPTLDQCEWVRDIKTADWPGVARLCSERLQAVAEANYYRQLANHATAIVARLKPNTLRESRDDSF